MLCGSKLGASTAEAEIPYHSRLKLAIHVARPQSALSCHISTWSGTSEALLQMTVTRLSESPAIISKQVGSSDASLVIHSIACLRSSLNFCSRTWKTSLSQPSPCQLCTNHPAVASRLSRASHHLPTVRAQLMQHLPKSSHLPSGTLFEAKRCKRFDSSAYRQQLSVLVLGSVSLTWWPEWPMTWVAAKGTLVCHHGLKHSKPRAISLLHHQYFHFPHPKIWAVSASLEEGGALWGFYSDPFLLLLLSWGVLVEWNVFMLFC